ncbi:MAG: 3-phosphoserine/phosphohydroxythreonine transaminase [Planctomycetales bacterium]|nr:3-phosphoserine/phosphohydroxythreonine transaminase [Planctomycetales bacterium]
MSERVFNFSAGPAVLPIPVLEEIQRDMLVLPGAGASILEISHRGKDFVAVLEDAERQLRDLLAIPNNYKVLFLQGGSRLQFSMVPMNLLRGSGKTADYLLTGSWGKKALDEAVKEGATHVCWDGKPHNYDRLPAAGELQLSDNSAYVHITSNETIEGVQFSTEPDVGDTPLVADLSSDFLSRPVPVERYGLIYACAQKNAGPAGVTVVIIRDDLLALGDKSLPGMLLYRNHSENDSCYNTPPTFGVYVVGLIAKWLQEEIGGLASMAERNQEKAALLYDVIDDSDGFYQGHAARECRSLMNVTFRLPSEDLEKSFLQQATERDLCSLAGHRSVGGIRASIYNAMPRAGVEALRDFMQEFRQAN